VNHSRISLHNALFAAVINAYVLEKDDVDTNAHRDLLKSEIERIQEGVEILQDADFNNAINKFRIGFDMFHQNEKVPKTGHWWNGKFGKMGWRRYLRTAKDNAEIATSTAHSVNRGLIAFTSYAQVSLL